MALGICSRSLGEGIGAEVGTLVFGAVNVFVDGEALSLSGAT